MNKEITDLKIGVLGGGQLGRMMLQSALDFNLDISIMDPDPDAPCASLVKNFTVGKLKDYDAVMEFGKDKDLITIEIESVNTDALKDLQNSGVEVFPQPEIIELIQDKRKQKTFYKAHRIPTADFVLVDSKEEVRKYADKLPLVNKLSKEGYDGRGVQILKSGQDLENAFDAPGLLEDLVDFDKEVSVIVSRNKDGKVSTFPVVELSFHPTANLVEFLFSPAEVSKEVEEKARDLAIQVVNQLNMVGLLAVEMFLTKKGELLVNEVAPRTHNSGHQTIEGNVTSQFEQHLRAILNLPPGNTQIVQPSAMVNLLGAEGFTGVAQYRGLDRLLSMENVHIHLYGKKLTKPFRKMGHVTITDSSLDKLKAKAREVKNVIRIES